MKRFIAKTTLYLTLTKPGVLFGNALTVAVGYLFAARGFIDGILFLWLIVGSTLVIASACVLNNYFDRDIDRIMTRTQKRAVASGRIPGSHAVIFGVVLLLLGFLLLIFTSNLLVVCLGLLGFIDYLFLYGMLSKRKSIHGTLVGSISGAIPILAGYVAARGSVDIGGVLVFLVLFFWQLPEFYSIAIYRYKEYKTAGVPVITVVKGISFTKQQIIIYVFLFMLSSLLLFSFGYTGIVYLLVMGGLNGVWLLLAIHGLMTTNTDRWARTMFKFSLIILLTFCLLLSIDLVLP